MVAPDESARRRETGTGGESLTRHADRRIQAPGGLHAFQPPPPGLTQAGRDAAPWLALTHPYVQPGMKHDLDDIRAAAAARWAAEMSGKIPRPETKP